MPSWFHFRRRPFMGPVYCKSWWNVMLDVWRFITLNGVARCSLIVNALSWIIPHDWSSSSLIFVPYIKMPSSILEIGFIILGFGWTAKTSFISSRWILLSYSFRTMHLCWYWHMILISSVQMLKRFSAIFIWLPPSVLIRSLTFFGDLL